MYRIPPLILAAAFLLAACTDPFISIPGGRLEGQTISTPDAWTSVPDVVQLEMRPDDPYSINIWAVVAEGNLYIATQDADWTAFLAENSAVRMRADGKLYDLRAIRVTGPPVLAAVAAAYSEKYDYEADADSFDSAQVYRLTER